MATIPPLELSMADSVHEQEHLAESTQSADFPAKTCHYETLDSSLMCTDTTDSFVDYSRPSVTGPVLTVELSLGVQLDYALDNPGKLFLNVDHILWVNTEGWMFGLPPYQLDRMAHRIIREALGRHDPAKLVFLTRQDLRTVTCILRTEFGNSVKVCQVSELGTADTVISVATQDNLQHISFMEADEQELERMSHFEATSCILFPIDRCKRLEPWHLTLLPLEVEARDHSLNWQPLPQ